MDEVEVRESCRYPGEHREHPRVAHHIRALLAHRSPTLQMEGVDEILDQTDHPARIGLHLVYKTTLRTTLYFVK